MPNPSPYACDEEHKEPRSDVIVLLNRGSSHHYVCAHCQKPLKPVECWHCHKNTLWIDAETDILAAGEGSAADVLARDEARRYGQYMQTQPDLGE